MVLGSAVTFLNATVVNIALPAIGDEFDTDLAGLQWVTNGYLLTLASLVLLGGSAGDIFGRRRVFLWGIGVFVAASIACALAPSLLWLIGGRFVQGIGAAAMTPASLAIVDASFHPDDQSQAVGAWASGSALAAAAGPFLGGYLVDAIDWRWVFVISLPLAAASAFATATHVPESRDPTTGRHLDLWGGALAMIAVVGVVYALVQGPVDGWSDPVVVVLFALGVFGALAFALSQARQRDPMMPLRLFDSTQFSGTNVMTLVVYFAIGGAFFFTAIQYQTVVGFSALEAGAANVPMSIVMIIGSPRAGKLSAQYGPRWFLTAGPLIAAVGMVWLGRIDEGANYLTDILPPVLVIGVGLAAMVAPLTASVLASVGERDVGIASAVNNAVARVGGLLATAMLPLAAGLSGGFAGAEFAAGYQRALWICAGLSAAAGLVAYLSVDTCVATHTSQQASITSGCVQRSRPQAQPAR